MITPVSEYEQVPVRASRANGYQCPCGGLLHEVDASETGSSYVCHGGHGWLFYRAWGFDGLPRWAKADAVYAKVASEQDEAQRSRAEYQR